MSLYDGARILASNGLKPTELADFLGFTLYYAPIGKFKGIVSKERQNFILIDADLAETERQAVCAQQLGHFYLHQDLDYLSYLENNPEAYALHEYQANRFACILMLGNRAKRYESQIEAAARSGNWTQLIELLQQINGKMKKN